MEKNPTGNKYDCEDDNDIKNCNLDYNEDNNCYQKEFSSERRGEESHCGENHDD